MAVDASFGLIVYRSLDGHVDFLLSRMVLTWCQASVIRELFIHYSSKVMSVCNFGVEGRGVLQRGLLRIVRMLLDAERYKSIIDEEKYTHPMHCMYGFKRVPYQAFCNTFYWAKTALTTLLPSVWRCFAPRWLATSRSSRPLLPQDLCKSQRERPRYGSGGWFSESCYSLCECQGGQPCHGQKIL
jgi:hypothetical protein